MNLSNRIALAHTSLLGLSIGDAFGESFFGNTSDIEEYISGKRIPKTDWNFTDDTIMAIAVFEELEQNGSIDQEHLVKKFCSNHDLDPNRGYGATLRKLLREVKEGGNWQILSELLFDGQGSMGNGAAMRTSPIGAYHFDNMQNLKENTIKASTVTHTNPEAINGAIAIAVATSLAVKIKSTGEIVLPTEFIEIVANELDDCETKAKIKKSKTIPYSFHIKTVTDILGNGLNMTSQDTVPFVVWCAAHNLLNFEAALWKAVSALGDRDTICAMIGGITIMSSDPKHIPENWLNSVENFDLSPFRKNNS